MSSLPAFAIGVSGLVTGAAIGFFTRRARLCSFGAVEDALIGHDWRRIKIFGLALGIALLGTQALILAGLFDPATTTYSPMRLPWLSTDRKSVV